MGAPKGNQYALGNKGGAPRTVSFSKEEMIALGQEMIDWLKKTPNVLHLSEWYTCEKKFIFKQWETFIERDEFMPYHEEALRIIGKQYLDKNSNIREGVSQRWQRIYFPDLRKREDQDLRQKMELEIEKEAAIAKMKEDKAFTPEMEAQLSKLMDQLLKDKTK